MKSKQVKQNQSVGKVINVMEEMAAAGGPMRLLDIATNVQMPASTTLRFLTTLVVLGYVRQNADTMRYELTLKLCGLADQIRSQKTVRDVARPHLKMLAKQLGESTFLAVEEDLEAVYIEVAEGQGSGLRTLQRIGKRAPLHSTGVGKVLLSDFDDDRLDRLITDRGLPKLTVHTISTKEALIHDLDEIRTRGYAFDLEECEEGVRCVAAPVRDHEGKIVAALSVSAPVNRMKDQDLPEVIERVLAAAEATSKEL
ncbi:MAG TPA: IclR family transcriptional regulator [Spirochaetia bacterium]|nr:IclR family transcriptional regulator [Spirochaetia bacterium]